MRYYSTMRPIGPGACPKEGLREVVNYDERRYVGEIDRDAWGYAEYDRELGDEARDYDLIPAGVWYGVDASSEMHGGDLRARILAAPKYGAERPEDERGCNGRREYKVRYFKGLKEAERVRDAINTIEVTVERTRRSVTQGSCKVFVNGELVVDFGDMFKLLGPGDKPEDFYGENVDGWVSQMPDSSFVLGIMWNPKSVEKAFRFGRDICRILGIDESEWIE